jgi:glycosyltransferase involved in cell wall biosynthesis
VTLLRAMPELPDCFLALAGDGPLRPELETLAQDLGVADRVRFLGRIPDIPALLATADLYAQPSRFEGFPRATGEAMATGLPVVVSDGAGFSELVGDVAIRFPIGDAVALARAVRQAIAEKEKRGRRSLERAESLSIQDCAQKHLGVYESILRGHRI